MKNLWKLLFVPVVIVISLAFSKPVFADMAADWAKVGGYDALVNNPEGASSIPSSNSKSVSVIPYGSTVSVDYEYYQDGVDQAWVEWNNETYLVMKSDLTPLEFDMSQCKSVDPDQYGVAIAQTSVYSGPSTIYPVVAMIEPGTTFHVVYELDMDSDYYYVEGDSFAGWVVLSYSGDNTDARPYRPTAMFKYSESKLVMCDAVLMDASWNKTDMVIPRGTCADITGRYKERGELGFDEYIYQISFNGGYYYLDKSSFAKGISDEGVAIVVDDPSKLNVYSADSFTLLDSNLIPPKSSYLPDRKYYNIQEKKNYYLVNVNGTDYWVTNCSFADYYWEFDFDTFFEVDEDFKTYLLEEARYYEDEAIDEGLYILSGSSYYSDAFCTEKIGTLSKDTLFDVCYMYAFLPEDSDYYVVSGYNSYLGWFNFSDTGIADKLKCISSIEKEEGKNDSLEETQTSTSTSTTATVNEPDKEETTSTVSTSTTVSTSVSTSTSTSTSTSSVAVSVPSKDSISISSAAEPPATSEVTYTESPETKSVKATVVYCVIIAAVAAILTLFVIIKLFGKKKEEKNEQ